MQIETYHHKLILVDSSNAAIACYTAQAVILCYYKHKIRTIKLPTHEALTSITVAGGDLVSEDCVQKQSKKSL